MMLCMQDGHHQRRTGLGQGGQVAHVVLGVKVGALRRGGGRSGPAVGGAPPPLQVRLVVLAGVPEDVLVLVCGPGRSGLVGTLFRVKPVATQLRDQTSLVLCSIALGDGVPRHQRYRATELLCTERITAYHVSQFAES